MTFQISKFNESKASSLALTRKVALRAVSNLRMFAIAFLVTASVSIHAQETVPMQALIGQSLSKLQEPTPSAFLNCIAEMKRIEAMFPDSIQPKYQTALQSLNFAVMNPQAEQTDNLLAAAEQTIGQMEKMKNCDPSDICTLNGFLYMVRIVQNPQQNGQRYYLDVLQNFEKALKLNPENVLAEQLQQKFLEGMRQVTGGAAQSAE